jgi:hypothetical protein
MGILCKFYNCRSSAAIENVVRRGTRSTSAGNNIMSTIISGGAAVYVLNSSRGATATASCQLLLPVSVQIAEYMVHSRLSSYEDYILTTQVSPTESMLEYL